MSHMLIIFIAGFLASLFATLIGGSSLVTISTLLLLGCPPHTAIGTDRFGIMGVCSAGWYQSLLVLPSAPIILIESEMSG